jgi:hypothetical protein
MEAVRGPRGVADAVNSSAVLSVVFVIIANLDVGNATCYGSTPHRNFPQTGGE